MGETKAFHLAENNVISDGFLRLGCFDSIRQAWQPIVHLLIPFKNSLRYFVLHDKSVLKTL